MQLAFGNAAWLSSLPGSSASCQDGRGGGAQVSGEYANHLDFLSRGPYAQFVVEKRSVGQYPIRMFRTAQPAGDFSDPAQPDVVLYKILRSEARTVRDLGAGRVRHRFRRGDFDLQGPGVASKGPKRRHHPRWTSES